MKGLFIVMEGPDGSGKTTHNANPHTNIVNSAVATNE